MFYKIAHRERERERERNTYTHNRKKTNKKNLGQRIVWCVKSKDFTRNFRPPKVKMSNKVFREKSNCVVFQSSKSRFFNEINEITNNFLLVGGKIMPEMHLKQPEFTYSVCDPFTKNK